MRIKLDDKHYLNSDKYCYWITVEVVMTKGKRVGQVDDRLVSGYARTFNEAIDSFLEYAVRESDATTLKELSKTIRDLKAQIKKWKLVITE